MVASTGNLTKAIKSVSKLRSKTDDETENAKGSSIALDPRRFGTPNNSNSLAAILAGNRPSPYSALGSSLGIPSASGSISGDSKSWDDFTKQIGGGGRGGNLNPNTPPTGGGNPLLGGYHFGAAAPKALPKPAGVNLDDNTWGLMSIYSGLKDSNQLAKLAEPYIAQGIRDPWALALSARHQLSPEHASSLTRLIADDHSNQLGNVSRFEQLEQARGNNPADSWNKLHLFCGIERGSAYNISGRALSETVASIDGIQRLAFDSKQYAQTHNGQKPNASAYFSLFCTPGADFNGVFSSAKEGQQVAQASAVKNITGGFTDPKQGGASNIYYLATQGSDKKLYDGVAFFAEQANHKNVNLDNVVINIHGHGSGVNALIGHGGETGSVGDYDSATFKEIGKRLAHARNIEINFDSCSNGALAARLGQAVAEGVRERRQELARDGIYIDHPTVVLTSGAIQESWKTMDNGTATFVNVPNANGPHERMNHTGDQAANNHYQREFTIPANPNPNQSTSSKLEELVKKADPST